MATTADVRKIAMGFEGVREIDHFARPAFRTSKRIFAVIRPDGVWLYLPPERKDFLFAAAPKTFVKHMWGRTPELLLQIERIGLGELKKLLKEAFEAAGTSPKKRKSGAKRVSSRANRKARP